MRFAWLVVRHADMLAKSVYFCAVHHSESLPHFRCVKTTIQANCAALYLEVWCAFCLRGLHFLNWLCLRGSFVIVLCGKKRSWRRVPLHLLLLLPPSLRHLRQAQSPPLHHRSVWTIKQSHMALSLTRYPSSTSREGTTTIRQAADSITYSYRIRWCVVLSRELQLKQSLLPLNV